MLYRMKKSGLILLCLFLCGELFAQEKTRYIVIDTNMGRMKVKLYNTTPRHRDHFTELATKGYFDETLFARVVKEYVIQGGSQDSRNAPKGARIGFGSNSMFVDAEDLPDVFPKKGVICAPRQPEKVNPKKRSDGSQFFIVQGRVYRKGELDTLEMAKNNPIKNRAMEKLYPPIKKELDSLREANPALYNQKARALRAAVDSILISTPGSMHFLPEEREAYTTVGGAPNLRGDYAIFGEVVEGLEVIDKIANLKTDAFERPLTDVKMTVKVVSE